MCIDIGVVPVPGDKIQLQWAKPDEQPSQTE